MMTSTKNARLSRGRYVSAGYASKEKKEQGAQLYIASEPAGSARDNLRDMNKAGYRTERPWRDTPTPVFESEPIKKETAVKNTRYAPKKKSKRQLGLIDRLLLEAQRDRKGVAACIVLFALMLTMTAVWGQKMVEGVNVQRDIQSYQDRTISLQKENEKLRQQLEIAENGERIRNLAQNELGMLRRERAQTETIYIHAPEKQVQEQAQEAEQTHMDILDFLLGLLNVFHIGE